MEPQPILDATQLAHRQDAAVEQWHAHCQDPPVHTAENQPDLPTTEDLAALILAQHRANFDLWHAEDLARDPDATDTSIANVKRTIDRLNQQRNDLVEAVDTLLHKTLQQRESAVIHSETPGMIVDRMSIMALKLYHTRQETVRSGATQAQHEKNLSRLTVLQQQRGDLALALNTLMEEIAAGNRRFKLYRQMKMYNDPDLNPVLYRRGRG